MMRFEHEGKAYKVVFDHVVGEDTRDEDLNAVTTATIVPEDIETGPLVSASAYCRKPDNFSRKIGRQIALGRALIGMGMAKPQRLGLIRKA